MDKPTDILHLNDSLAFNLHRAALLLRRDLIRTLSEFDITPEQWQILLLLWEEEGSVSQKEIVQKLLKDKHAVSRMIQRMEKRGWIYKIVSSTDSRVTLIQITEHGRSIKEEMYKKLSHHVRGEVFNTFSQEEKDSVKDFLKRLRNALGDNWE